MVPSPPYLSLDKIKTVVLSDNLSSLALLSLVIKTYQWNRRAEIQLLSFVLFFFFTDSLSSFPLPFSIFLNLRLKYS